MKPTLEVGSCAEIEAAHQALDAAGVPPGPLAQRVLAYASPVVVLASGVRLLPSRFG